MATALTMSSNPLPTDGLQLQRQQAQSSSSTDSKASIIVSRSCILHCRNPKHYPTLSFAVLFYQSSSAAAARLAPRLGCPGRAGQFPPLLPDGHL